MLFILHGQPCTGSSLGGNTQNICCLVLAVWMIIYVSRKYLYVIITDLSGKNSSPLLGNMEVKVHEKAMHDVCTLCCWMYKLAKNDKSVNI